MPAGTTVAIANNNVNYQIDWSLGHTQNATVSIDDGTPVLNTNNLGGTPITIKVSGGAICSGGPVLQYLQGSVDVVVMTLGVPNHNGIKTTIPFTVTGNTITIIPSVAFAFGSTSVKAGAGITLKLQLQTNLAIQQQIRL